MEVAVELPADVGEQPELLHVLAEERDHQGPDQLRRVRQHVDEGKRGEGVDVLALGELLRRRFGDRRQRADEIEIGLAERGVEDGECMRRVLRLALMGDELIAVAALLDGVGGDKRREGIAEIFFAVQRFGDVDHAKINLIGRQVFADRIKETIDVRLYEFLRVGEVGCDPALLRLRIKLVRWRRPIGVPVYALGDAKDDHDGQQKDAADHDQHDSDEGEQDRDRGVHGRIAGIGRPAQPIFDAHSSNVCLA